MGLKDGVCWLRTLALGCLKSPFLKDDNVPKGTFPKCFGLPLPALQLLGLWIPEPFSRAAEAYPILPGRTCGFRQSPPQPGSALERTSFSFQRGS